MKKINLLFISLLMFFMTSCVNETTIDIPNDYVFEPTEGNIIPINNVISNSSVIDGNIEVFMNVSKPKDEYPLVFKTPISRTNTVQIDFEHVFPIDMLEITNYQGKKASSLETVSVSYSLNGTAFTTYKQNLTITDVLSIDFNNNLAKSIRISFPGDKEYGISHIEATLGNGYYVMFDEEISHSFRRYTHWTGADGIFTFNLTNGVDRIGQNNVKTGYIFSDTFTGDVNQANFVRRSNHVINNSVGYMDGLDFSTLSFDYGMENQVAVSAFLPDYYLGSKARNLIDPQGLNITHTKDALLSNVNEGSMWKTELTNNIELTLDFYGKTLIEELYLWNYNEENNIGLKKISVHYSDDNKVFEELGVYEINMASGDDLSPYQLKLDLNVNAKHLKIKVLESYDREFVGLGKIMAFTNNEYINFKIDATSNDLNQTANELTSRLWLQDGVVIDNYLYVFAILVKDYQDFFKVHNVGMLKIPIVNDQFDFEKTIYLDSPLQARTKDGGEIFFGAGVTNLVFQDGYIYVYGYKDLNGRHLVVARVKPEDFENFNKWEYFDGTIFQNDITKVSGLLKGVSAEMSVTYIEEGLNAGKYMAVSMEETISGKISYSLGDSPTGPFSDWNVIFRTNEHEYLTEAFAYNAKMHTHLSEKGKYLISYNVNTHSLFALMDAKIYYPRFIWLIEVNSKGN